MKKDLYLHLEKVKYNKVNLSDNKRKIQSTLKQDKLFKTSLCYILLCIIISIFAYIIIPDKTPHADNQMIELSVKSPGYNVDILCINEIKNQDRFKLRDIFYGKQDTSTEIPITAYEVKGDTIYYETIDGNDSFHILNNDENYEVKHRKFIFGTDRYGRDVFSRLILGTRVSLSIGAVSVVLSLLIGVIIGSAAGYYRGWVDKLLLWLINVVWAIPSVLLVIAISFALGRGFWQVFIAIGFTLWVDVARMVRGQVISIKEMEYVDAAKVLGYNSLRIIGKHILPNIISPLIVLSASNFATAILLEAGLSFLGIGVQPPMASWGMMIKEGYSYLILGHPYLSIIPGIAIMLLVLAFMMLGNSLRDALDVKTKS